MLGRRCEPSIEEENPMTANPIFARILLAGLAPAAVTLAHAQASDPPKKDAEPEKMESIVVQGQFLSPSAESAMKLDVPIRDTPLSVTNYSTDFMKAIETTEVLDLYKYMTGVNRGGQSAYDLSLRGFKTTWNDRNALRTDGPPGQGPALPWP